MADAIAGRLRRRSGCALAPAGLHPEFKEIAMRFTVVICTRNRAHSLGEVLSSIDRADRPEVEWELVVVDNGGADDTPAIVESFANRLPIRRVFEGKAGLSNARNTGVANARGAYILWTDDDVLVRPEWLRAFAAAFDAHPDAAVFGGHVRPLYAEPRVDWFVRAENKLHSLLAYRDFEGPVTPDRVPFGACYALRAAEQRAHLYDPDLGVAPGRRTGGEETAVVRAILNYGGTGVWVPGGAVDHVIVRERQTVEYVQSYYRSLGRQFPAKWRGGTSPLVAGAPLRLWLRTGRLYLQYRLRRALGRDWVGMLTLYARTRGTVDSWRSRAPR